MYQIDTPEPEPSGLDEFAVDRNTGEVIEGAPLTQAECEALDNTTQPEPRKVTGGRMGAYLVGDAAKLSGTGYRPGAARNSRPMLR